MPSMIIFYSYHLNKLTVYLYVFHFRFILQFIRFNANHSFPHANISRAFFLYVNEVIVRTFIHIYLQC